MEVMDSLPEAISQVENGDEKKDLFLPELVGASDALEGATPIAEEAIRQRGGEKKDAWY
jgi:hypothetical protein